MRYKRTKEIGNFFEMFEKEYGECNWDRCAQNFMNHPNYNNGRELLLDVYLRAFMNYHKSEVLKKLAKNESGFRVYKAFNPSIDYSIVAGYSGKFSVYGKTRRLKGECDGLVNISGTPVIMNFFYKEFPKEENERTEIFSRIFRDIGYGIIATRDRIGKRARNFQSRGGIVVSFMRKEELKMVVRGVCSKYGFRIKEDFA